jgi:hypothetical protein
MLKKYLFLLDLIFYSVIVDVSKNIFLFINNFFKWL